MKRVLSLVLALVMVALMIPVAAITSVATEETSAANGGDTSALDAQQDSDVLHYMDFTDPNHVQDSTEKIPYPSITMPDGWVISKDDLANWENRVDANGVTLGSQAQYVQMNTKDGVGIGQKRVLAIDFGIDSKIQIMRISWEPNAGTAQAYNWHNGSDLDIVFAGGPKEPNNSEDAKLCIKMCTGTSYTWQNNNRYYSVAVTKLVDGERVTTTSNLLAYRVDTSTDFMKVLADGANKGTGTQMVVYFDISENNKITAIHQKYVYHDANGNFVSEIVASMPVNLANVIVCDGYLTIGHNGWGGNTALTVKSVNINAGSYAEMGESIYSEDFKAYGKENPQKLTEAIATYKTDRTNRYNADGKWNLTLPEGYIHHENTDDRVSSISKDYGVTLSGDGDGIIMTTDPDKDEDHIIEVKFASHYKFAWLGFGWSATAPTDASYALSNIATTSRLTVGYGSTNAEGTAFDASIFAQVNAGGSLSDEIYKNGVTTTVTDLQSDDDLKNAIKNDDELTVRISVIGGVVNKVYLLYGENTVVYTPAAEIAATGYLSLWCQGWAGNNEVDIHSVKITKLNVSIVGGQSRESKTTDKAVDIRFLATIKEDFAKIQNYDSIGFEFTNGEGQVGEVKCYNVYQSVYANGVLVNASEDYDASRFYCFTITDITEGDYTLYIRCWIQKSESAEKIYSDPIIISFSVDAEGTLTIN